MGGAQASGLHLLGECLGSEQELPQLAARCVPGSWAGCARSQPAAFIKELITLTPTCLRLLEVSTWLSFGPTVPHVVHCLYPMPVAASAQSRCLRGGPWRLLSLGRRTWCTKGAPLSEAGVLRLQPSGLVRWPVSRIPAGSSRSSRSPTAT